MYPQVLRMLTVRIHPRHWETGRKATNATPTLRLNSTPYQVQPYDDTSSCITTRFLPLHCCTERIDIRFRSCPLLSPI